jgi:uncharacterized protein
VENYLKIFIIGGSGFIGQSLIEGLLARGHRPTLLLRSRERSPFSEGSVDMLVGNPMEGGSWQDIMADHNVIINLAGATIFRRWSESAKKEILSSRIMTTRRIVEGLRNSARKKVQFFNASGVGYYGSQGNEALDEYAPPGNTFLSRVAVEWESEARKAEESGIRVIRCRFGIVLGRSGGALTKIERLVRLHLGGSWGRGEQWFSWIHVADVVGAFLFLLEHRDVDGAINFTAPEPVRNKEMIHDFNLVLNRRPFIRAIPELLFRSILGEFSGEFLDGQRVVPHELLANGFAFQYPSFKGALSDLL